MVSFAARSAVVARTLLAPLERVKMELQINKAKSIRKTARRIVRTEGEYLRECVHGVTGKTRRLRNYSRIRDPSRRTLFENGIAC